MKLDESADKNGMRLKLWDVFRRGLMMLAIAIGVALSGLILGCSATGSILDMTSGSSLVPTLPSTVTVPDPEGLLADPIATQARLLWAAPAGSSISGYRIAVSLSGLPEAGCATGVVGTSSSVSFDLTSLTENTTYYYRVCSVSGGVNSTGVAGSFKTLKYVARVSAYSSNSNWNDYILNDGTKPYNATQATCTTTSYGFNGCINGGLFHKMTIPGVINCSRIQASDSLGVFRWFCDTTATDTIIYSTDLQPYKGLMDLIENNQFKKNYVVVKVDGVRTYSSASEKWWTNVIDNLPASPSTTMTTITNSGETSGKIYVVNSNMSGGGYSISEDKISFVVMRGAELSEDASSGSFSNMLVKIPSPRRFIWIEGKYASQSSLSSNIISLASAMASYCRFHNIEVSSTTSAQIGIYLGSAISNIITDFFLHDLSKGVSNSGGNTLVSNGRISQASSDGISYLAYSAIVNVIFSGNLSGSRLLAYPNSSHFLNGTFVNNHINSTALYPVLGTAGNLYHNMLAINSGRILYTWRASAVVFSQLMSGSNSGNDLDVQRPETAGHKFTNNLVLESTFECSVNQGVSIYDPGLVNNTCANSGSSDAVLRLVTFDFTKIFAGKVLTNDVANPNDNSGTSPFSAITDWIHFDNGFRFWGLDGAVFPDTTNQGACTSGACRIWDYRLKADAANMAYNNTDTVIAKNNPFVGGATCPSEVHGNKVTSYTNGLPVTYTFLTHAQEVIGDGLGNDNGLCESGESCIYTPNFGAYQGEGDIYANGPCTFQDGTVTGVKMYAYPINGVL